MNRNENLSQCPHFIEYKTFVVKDFGFFVNLNGIFFDKKTDRTPLFFLFAFGLYLQEYHAKNHVPARADSAFYEELTAQKKVF